MKRLILILFLFAFVKVNATTYHVATDGSGNYTTIAQINGASFIAGDSVLLRKGDTWREQLIVPSSGYSGNPIVFGSYGTGNNPIISGSNIYSGFSNAGSNVWDISATTQPNVVLKSRNLQTKVASKAAITSEGKWYWTGNVLSIYATSDPSGTVEAGYRNRALDTNDKSYLTFDGITFECANQLYGSMIYTTHSTENDVKFYNCTIQYSAGSGFRVGGSADGNTVGCLIDNCTIRYNWNDGIFSQYDGDITINNCQIYSNGLIPTQEFNGIFGKLGGFKITNCNIYDNGRYLGLAHGIYQYITNGAVTITNCTIHDQPNGSAIRLRGSGIVAQCTLYNNSDAGVNMDTNDIYNVTYTLVSNLIYGNHVNGVIKGGASATGTVDLIMYNNTVYHTGSAEVLAIAQLIKSIVLKNNIFYSSASRLIGFEYRPTTSTIDYNIYLRSDGIDNRWKAGNGVYCYTIAEWQAQGFDTHGYYVDPLFISTSDFQLQSTSTAINAGVSVGLTTDYTGHVFEGLPDVGAYEYITPYTPPIVRTKGISAGGGKAGGINGVPYGL